MTIVDMKKDMTKAWRILEGDFSKKQKEDAYNSIIILTNTIRETDKEFTLNDKALEKYKEFKPKDTPQLDRKVKWAKYDSSDRSLGERGDLENEYNYFIQTAVRIVSKRLPDVDTDSDKFGTIVNATVANLIAMGKH